MSDTTEIPKATPAPITPPRDAPHPVTVADKLARFMAQMDKELAR